MIGKSSQARDLATFLTSILQGPQPHLQGESDWCSNLFIREDGSAWHLGFGNTYVLIRRLAKYIQNSKLTIMTMV